MLWKWGQSTVAPQSPGFSLFFRGMYRGVTSHMARVEATFAGKPREPEYLKLWGHCACLSCCSARFHVTLYVRLKGLVEWVHRRISWPEGYEDPWEKSGFQGSHIHLPLSWVGRFPWFYVAPRWAIVLPRFSSFSVGQGISLISPIASTWILQMKMLYLLAPSVPLCETHLH